MANPFGGGEAVLRYMLPPAEEWLCSSRSNERLFPCSSNLFEFLGKRLPFRCVARAGGGRESKATAKRSELPGRNLTRTLGAHNCLGYGGCDWLFFLAGGRMVGGG